MFKALLADFFCTQSVHGFCHNMDGLYMIFDILKVGHWGVRGFLSNGNEGIWVMIYPEGKESISHLGSEGKSSSKIPWEKDMLVLWRVPLLPSCCLFSLQTWTNFDESVPATEGDVDVDASKSYE